VTPRSLGILVGAAALVAAASFALGNAKKGKPASARSVPLERAAPELLDARRDAERDLTREEERAEAQGAVVAQDRPEPESAGTNREEGAPASLPPEGAEEEKEIAQTARELHLPVIRAIRGDHVTPEARKKAMLKALRDSGPTSDGWARRGRQVFESWERLLGKSVHQVALHETARCYQAGCEVSVRFASREDAERAQDAFRELLDPGPEVHGGRVQTPAVEVGGGAYEAVWIMLRPEG
jgi:hypothetical protein